MLIQISILKQIAETLDGERLYALIKERLLDIEDIEYRASISQQLVDPPEVPP